VEASKKLEEAAETVGDSVWWKSQHEFITVPLPTFQDKLRLKGTGLGDTHVQYLALRVGVKVALLVSTFSEMGEGVDPVSVHKFYKLSNATQSFGKVVLLHLRDMGFGGHFEAVQCDGIGALCSDHAFLQKLRAQYSKDSE
jgi:hypothetical protein